MLTGLDGLGEKKSEVVTDRRFQFRFEWNYFFIRVRSIVTIRGNEDEGFEKNWLKAPVNWRLTTRVWTAPTRWRLIVEVLDQKWRLNSSVHFQRLKPNRPNFWAWNLTLYFCQCFSPGTDIFCDRLLCAFVCVFERARVCGCVCVCVRACACDTI